MEVITNRVTGWVQGIQQYLLDVRTEFDKITWPSQKEYVGGTIGVLVIVVLMTIILGVADALLSTGFEWLINGLPRWLNG